MKQVCVIGLGQFGSHLARTLVKMGCEVLAIDINEQRVEDVRDDVHRALIGDARNLQMLKSVLTQTVAEVVVCLGEGNIEPSILCTLHLSRLKIPSIRCTATNDDHAQILSAVGATEITFPERDTAARLARSVATPDLKDMFSLSGDYRIMEMTAPKVLHGKTLADVNLRQTHNVLVLAVRDPGDDDYHFLPESDTVIKQDEVLMVLGRELDLVQLVGRE
ncbi:MAG: TrkA family potassium uptake protein [Phycisphaerae bacterium]|nr:TrkA family potassium uptake protein [Phycisphaerae bacterium]